MNVLLVYYTGTYNTRYVTSLLKSKFEKEGHTVVSYEIDPLKIETLSFEGYDLVGLGYPIYGFNAPLPFLRFIKKQHFPKGIRTFIYKNSGETFHANDASSVNVVHKLKKDKAIIDNEYHFIMPYNIHFRFEDNLIKEMLTMDHKLLDILYYEVTNSIKNIKKYKFIHRVITFFVKLQFIGGNINSFFYKVDNKECSKCGMCVNLCPMKNVYKNKKGNIKFHHHCLMCMRCSFYCPKNAIRIGLFDSWRVNGAYDYKKILELESKERIINENTKGFFKCYIETYNYIDSRWNELFGDQNED